jgi:lysozyme
MSTNLKSMITLHEGERLKMYQDTKGIWTIGVGHNIEEKGISKAVSQMMLEEDLAEAAEDARTFNWFGGLDEVRQAVVIDMIFNMGLTRFSRFRKTIGYIERGMYRSASVEMLDSKWAREDVAESRSGKLSKMMETGEWQ